MYNSFKMVIKMIRHCVWSIVWFMIVWAIMAIILSNVFHMAKSQVFLFIYPFSFLYIAYHCNIILYEARRLDEAVKKAELANALNSVLKEDEDKVK